MHRTTKQLNMLRVPLILIICSVLLSLFVFPVSAVESGACGEGVTWELNAGTLTIRGKGSMTDYKDRELAPWYEFREDIVRLEISPEVTSIGNFAFYGCKNITTVEIPNSVKTIGKFAFTSCERLSVVQFGGGLLSIGESAFNNCTSLTSLRVPYSLTSLGTQAFYRCESLYSVYIPSEVQTMGNSVFAYCENLVRAEVEARLETLPSWTFYGCDLLSEVALADSVRDIDNNAFEQCDELANIYFAGTDEQAEQLEKQITADVPAFEIRGYISSGEISPSSTSGRYVENDDQTVTQTNITVMQDDRISLVHTVNKTYTPESSEKGSYTADISLTVEQNDAWDYAIDQVQQTFSYITNTYSDQANMEGMSFTLYAKNDAQITNEFLDELSGRDIKLVLVASNGSTWKVNCEDIKKSDSDSPSNKLVVNYSHQITEASKDTCQKLGTDDCYRLVFTDSVDQKAEVLVQLPPQASAQSNAFFYQVEPDGSHKRVQAVMVDNNGNAHFYIASVNKDAEYVIGLNVPGESTEDVIIPDELREQYDSPLLRLENVPYVELGRVSSLGITGNQLMWILIGVLLGTTVIVGGIMLMWNKNKQKKLAWKKLEESKKAG
ncbi:MAG: leucine-rich repeat domain-containing protein [Clostridia bacterium]|nr:leucine-rich repeat domain-containing protein [Clostridia bacterium]